MTINWVRGDENKKSILSNFFSIESTPKISDLRHEKFNSSSQEHHRGVNSFDNENFDNENFCFTLWV